jgi:hypothetical protein
VTFADGVTIDLVYPPELALERLSPASEVHLTLVTEDRQVRRQVLLVRAGSLPVPAGVEGADYLLLSFGEWQARVWIAVDRGAPPLTEVERSVWHRELAVEESATGFPTVLPKPHLHIARNPDERVAPVTLVLDAGDLNPRPRAHAP